MKLMGGVLLVLFIVRLCHPEVNKREVDERPDDVDSMSVVQEVEEPQQQLSEPEAQNLVAVEPAPIAPLTAPSFKNPDGSDVRHRIYSVPSYRECFPDVQDVQYPVAVANGVPPVQNRDEAEQRKSELLYVGSNPYYELDPSMSSSIPYLVPKASLLLQDIGRRFLDSLAVKGIPLHTIIVTSVLRTEDDVARLRRINRNASEQSCHRFATTFDISYNRYHTVSPPGEPIRRTVRNDSLKFVLSEVLRDMRQSGRCYIKHEVKQGCFHITVR